MTKPSQIALVVALSVTLLPNASRAADISALIPLCTEGRDSLAQRAAKIEALGLSRTKGESQAWVQGQVAHIAMSELEYGNEETRETYEGYKRSADAGDLFRDDIETYSFIDPARTLHVNLSAPEGNDPGCTIAFGKTVTDLQIPLRVRDTWTSQAGSFTEYRIGQGRYASLSTLGAPWDTWMKGRRLVSAFFVVTK